MKIIRTILGDIDPKEMGTVDAHDHLIRSGGPEIAINKAFLMNDVDAADREFKNYIKAGGKTMVCMDPIGCGRNVKKMLEVAERNRGKGHLLMTTGFQKGSLYCPETSFLATVDTNKVAEMMIAEVTEGMDIHSYNGPVVERTKAKAGLIKAGTSYRIVTKLEQKAINVAAITQKEQAVQYHSIRITAQWHWKMLNLLKNSAEIRKKHSFVICREILTNIIMKKYFKPVQAYVLTKPIKPCIVRILQ